MKRLSTPDLRRRTMLGLRNIASSALGQPLALRLMMAGDRAVLRVALSRGQRLGANKHVILNSPGEGNIGDQAMFESFVGNVPHEVVAIVKSPGAYSLPTPSDKSRVKFLVLPSLVYSKFLSHYRDIWTLGVCMRDAESFSVMGADIMDGGYGIHSSMVEWNIARALQDAGISSRILGFSWNGKAHPEVVKCARDAGRSGVRILPRDPDSYDRLLLDDVQGVVQSSDMVFAFLGKPGDALSLAELDDIKQAGKKVAVVNVSGLIGSKFEQDAEYEHLLGTLQELGYECLLLPHVSHSNVDDIAATTRLREKSELARRARFVERLIGPADVLSIVRRADVVVTGRMHLSILALSAGTPVIALATQGKVSGLMKLFGIPEHCIEPTAGFGARVSRLLVDLERNRQSIVQTMHSNLPAVRSLSKLNFDHSSSPAR